MKRFRLCLVVSICLFMEAHSVSQQSQPPKSGESDRLVAVIDAVTFAGAMTVSNDAKAAIASALCGETHHTDWLGRFQARAQRELQNSGYLEAVVTTKINSSRQADGVQHVTMVVAATEGPRYRVEGIHWTGPSPISEAELEHLSGLHPGDPFSANAFETTIAVVRGALAERGFRQSVIVPSWNLSREKGTVALYLDVTAGAKEANPQPPACIQLSDAEVHGAPFVPSTAYDPKRNGELDIARAELDAERLHKKVLIFVGGEWCALCVALERTFTKSPRLTSIMNGSFVVVYVDVGDENTNECVRRNLPNASTYPMVYVLDAKGKVLTSHDPVDWQSFEGFDSKRIEVFLRSWQ